MSAAQTELDQARDSIQQALRQRLLDWLGQHTDYRSYEDYTETILEDGRAGALAGSQRVVVYRGRRSVVVRPTVTGDRIQLAVVDEDGRRPQHQLQFELGDPDCITHLGRQVQQWMRTPPTWPR